MTRGLELLEISACYASRMVKQCRQSEQIFTQRMITDSDCISKAQPRHNAVKNLRQAYHLSACHQHTCKASRGDLGLIKGVCSSLCNQLHCMSRQRGDCYKAHKPSPMLLAIILTGDHLFMPMCDKAIQVLPHSCNQSAAC